MGFDVLRQLRDSVRNMRWSSDVPGLYGYHLIRSWQQFCPMKRQVAQQQSWAEGLGVLIAELVLRGRAAARQRGDNTHQLNRWHRPKAEIGKQ